MKKFIIFISFMLALASNLAFASTAACPSPSAINLKGATNVYYKPDGPGTGYVITLPTINMNNKNWVGKFYSIMFVKSVPNPENAAISFVQHGSNLHLKRIVDNLCIYTATFPKDVNVLFSTPSGEPEIIYGPVAEPKA